MKKNMMFMIPNTQDALSMAQFLLTLRDPALLLAPKIPRLI